MEFSQSMANIAAAFCKFQGEMINPPKKIKVDVKNKEGKFLYSYYYADLGTCVEAARSPLCKNGLSFLQNTVRDDKGNVVGVYTILMHESGEHIIFDPVTITPKQYINAQDIGNLLTYMRRYSLCLALGIATEDDDAQSQQHSQPQQQQTTQKPQQQQKTQSPKQQPKPQQGAKQLQVVGDTDDKQRKRFFAICGEKNLNLSEKQQKAIVYFYTNKESRSLVTEKEFEDMNEVLNKATMKEINATVQAAVQKKQASQGGAA